MQNRRETQFLPLQPTSRAGTSDPRIRGVKFSVLATGVDVRREFGEELLINSLPTNSGARSLGSTQVSLARTPDLIIERASSRVGIPHTGKIGCNPEFSSCFSRYARMSVKKRSPKATHSMPDATAALHFSFMMHS